MNANLPTALFVHGLVGDVDPYAPLHLLREYVAALGYRVESFEWPTEFNYVAALTRTGTFSTVLAAAFDEWLQELSAGKVGEIPLAVAVFAHSGGGTAVLRWLQDYGAMSPLQVDRIFLFDAPHAVSAGTVTLPDIKRSYLGRGRRTLAIHEDEASSIDPGRLAIAANNAVKRIVLFSECDRDVVEVLDTHYTAQWRPLIDRGILRQHVVRSVGHLGICGCDDVLRIVLAELAQQRE